MKANVILMLALAVIVLGAGYALFKPQHSAETPQAVIAPPPPRTVTQPTPQPPSPAVAATNQVIVQYASPNVYDIVVQRGKRVSEPAVLKVHQGDDVKFRITSDVADKFHLHGYNLEVPVSPERSAVLEFTAKLTGRFTYELHKSGLELGALEVYPQ
jgi:heme/copper-type cytochrome/quinol oxidase subunit 2